MINIEHPDIGKIERTGHTNETEIDCLCSWCGEPINKGDEHYIFDGEHVCKACVEECRQYE